MDEVDLIARALAQTCAGLVLAFAVTCRFFRMRGEASTYAVVTHSLLAVFAAYNCIEGWWHAPDGWFVIVGCAAIALLMTSTRGRWIGGLPAEFQRKSRSEKTDEPLQSPDESAVRCNRHVGMV